MKVRRRWLALLVLGALVLPRYGHAAGGRVEQPAGGDGLVDPAVVRASQALVGAHGPQAYVQLRQLAAAWETADPTQVEAALGAVAIDHSTAAPVAAYAGTLEAYARRQRGDLRGAEQRFARLGYVRAWWVLGPFDNDNKTALDQTLVAERELGQPIVADRSYQGKGHPVRWRRSPDVHPYGVIDLGTMLRPARDACALLTTYLRGEPRKLSLWIGATGAFKLYFNGQLALQDAAYRQLDPDRFATQVELLAGFNRLTVKACGDESPPAVSLRLAEADGSPAHDLQVVASEQASTAAAAAMRARASDPQRAAPPTRSAVVGPLTALEAALARAPHDPAVLERYARYLERTGGEAEGEHRARDMASRAATAAATVGRALLAAKLAEDRNRRRVWIDRAAALAKTIAERVDVLLARARLRRSGPLWRSAFPLYTEALRLQPWRVEAILGQVDLYIEAGLERTALSRLQAAVQAQPYRVALLRALAAELGALGRDAQASRVRARYAGLRFDDGGYLAEQIERAVARRDVAAVRRWASRLLWSDPASAWAHGVVARAYQGVGQQAAAIATYQRALAIAPGDIATLRALSDLHGLARERTKQLAYLRKILRLRPQSKQTRLYLEHLDPTRARDDEKLAWSPERFLALRTARDDRYARRTLRRLTVTTVYPNGLASHFKQDIFQPLTDEAAARSRQYAFVYHADRQVVQLRSAKVYRRDGRVDEAVESGSVPVSDPALRMYTLQRTFYVQLPRLQPGDVVAISYRIDDVAVRNEMSDYFGEIAYLQADEPIAELEYVLVAPKSKRLHLSVGPAAAAGAAPWRSLRRTVRVAGGRRTWSFVAKDVAPLRAEPAMPPYGERLAHVHVSSFDSWAQVSAWYHGLAREKLDVDDHVRALAHSLVKGLSTERDKVAAIYHYASSETRYVGLELGIEGVRPRRAALTLARGWGDCKDKATLIVAMLRVLGIKAQIVLLRTGLRGQFDTATASLAPFDHAVVYLPSLDLYLDGTAEATGTAELPALDRGALGLLVMQTGGHTVHLPQPPADSSTRSSTLHLRLNTTGELGFDGKLSQRGVGAPAWRHRYRDLSVRRERVASDLAELLGPVELRAGSTGLRVGDLEDVEKPVRLEVAGAASASREGAGWSVAMAAPTQMVARYASRPARRLPLRVGPLHRLTSAWSLELPRGWQVQSAPRSMHLTTPFGSYRVAVERLARKMVVRTELRVEAARISPTDYPAWRRFCQQVDAAGSPRVVVGR